MKTCYLNGNYIDFKDAKVSVMDRGFLFSDGLYEVIPVYNNKPFLIHEHLKRLQQGLDYIKIDFEASSLYEKCYELIEKNKPTNEFSIYMQITRGEQTQRDHRFINLSSPNVYMTLSACKYPTSYNQAHKALLKKDIRWQNCFIKSISLLPNVLYRQQAEEAGCIETIMFKEDQITEASASNVWMVKDNTVYTAPATEQILNGITRVFLITALKSAKIDIKEQNFSPKQLLEADEVWITSSTKEIQPIIQVEDKIIDSGKIGPIYKKAIAAFHAEKQNYYEAKKYL